MVDERGAPPKSPVGLGREGPLLHVRSSLAAPLAIAWTRQMKHGAAWACATCMLDLAATAAAAAPPPPPISAPSPARALACRRANLAAAPSDARCLQFAAVLTLALAIWKALLNEGLPCARGQVWVGADGAGARASGRPAAGAHASIVLPGRLGGVAFASMRAPTGLALRGLAVAATQQALALLAARRPAAFAAWREPLVLLVKLHAMLMTIDGGACRVGVQA